MIINLKVPSMVCEGCVDIVKKAIATHEPQAKVEIDLESKQVTVDTDASESSIRQIITAAEHTVE
ncbi:MAG: heavy-metal-associated domain-containing protein [Cyanobacteria bacterium P01_C01_bin.72]